MQDVPEPGGRGAFPPFFPPGAQPPKRPAVDCKPGSVPAAGCPTAGEDHSSRRHIAVPLEHSHPGADAAWRFGRAVLDSASIRACSGRGLPRRRSPGWRVGSYPTISPLPVPPPRALTRGLDGHRRCVSAALSLGSPRVAVNDLPAPWRSGRPRQSPTPGFSLGPPLRPGWSRTPQSPRHRISLQATIPRRRIPRHTRH